MIRTGFITTSELAAYLRISEQHVYRLIHERGLPAARVQGRWVFRQSRVDQWVYNHLQSGYRKLPRP